jgi:inorganic pyrophosphatase
MDTSAATLFIVISGIVGILFSLFQLWCVASISLDFGNANVSINTPLTTKEALESKSADGTTTGERLVEIYEAIREGADSFLMAEYRICAIFIVLFGAIVLCFVALGSSWTDGALTSIAFVVGSVTSCVSGYLGMKVAVFSNARTTISATRPGSEGWTASFNTAFRAGGVMGFSLCGIALLMLYALIGVYTAHFDITNKKELVALFECVAGFGLGGSSIAMFGRVGGGIYTKAADVGADLAGKVVEDIPEDDPRNPATIADNVGDNVGDVAGMGSDLFGSFGEATCAALVVGATAFTGTNQDSVLDWGALMFPLHISAVGILCCLVTSFFATNIMPVRKEADVEQVLKVQLGVSTLLMTGALYLVAIEFLPAEFNIVDAAAGNKTITIVPWKAWVCVCSGLWGGCIIGFITEYFTSHSYSPTREVAQSCETGAATNIIYGLALGYKSAIIPVTVLSVVVFFGFKLGGMYGVALAALGMLSTLATCLSIDVYGPICDNAGGIAEMAELPADVRDKTDALDAAGNTTAAIGKGFAIGSAALVSLALFGAFVTRVGNNVHAKPNPLEKGVDILQPITFAGLLMGSMLPYWFSAMTMKSVGTAAMEMVKEVAHQFKTKKGLLEGAPGHEKPDHAKCIKISTDASLREMIAPGALVMIAPLFAGTLFGVQAVCGVLAGGLVSGVQMAISASNTGGAWDNAKKYVEKGQMKMEVDGKLEVQGKGTDVHKAAVVGDTVGDPLKDTSGPALNILMKLMAIISLVFADYFCYIQHGRGLLNV